MLETAVALSDLLFPYLSVDQKGFFAGVVLFVVSACLHTHK